MSRAPAPAAAVPALTVAQQERLRFLETAMRALDAPAEVLRARGIARDTLALGLVRGQGHRWLLGADDAAAAAFLLLVEETHAAGEAAIAVAPPPA